MAAPMKYDGWFLLLSISLIMTILVYFKLDVSRIFELTTKCLLVLAVLTFCVHIFRKLKQKLARAPEFQSKYSEEQHGSKQSNHWLKKQEENDTKAASFEERISKPRREAHLKKTEEKYQSLSGPAWKGKGHVLEEEKQGRETATRRKGKQTGRDAVSARHLPDSAYPPPGSAQSNTKDTPKIKDKRMVKLPDEPPVGCDLETVTIGLRVPFGDIKRRRFLTSASIQVILDWLTVEGYNTKIYTVSTSYPRKDLSGSKTKTLQELGLVRDVILMVDEKGADPET